MVAVELLPLPSPAVYLVTSLTTIGVAPGLLVTVSTFDVFDVWPLLHLMTPVDGAPGLPAFLTSVAQFVPVVALVLLTLEPEVMPPPVQPTIEIDVLVTGLTSTLLLMT